MHVAMSLLARRRGLRVALGILILCTLAAGSFVLTGESPAEPEPTSVPHVLTHESADYFYTYHVLTGNDGLFCRRTDPDCLRNLTRTKPDVAQRLRRELEALLGVENLDVFRDPDNPCLKRLRGLGYL